jgi:hypothetical protein
MASTSVGNTRRQGFEGDSGPSDEAAGAMASQHLQQVIKESLETAGADLEAAVAHVAPVIAEALYRELHATIGERSGRAEKHADKQRDEGDDTVPKIARRATLQQALEPVLRDWFAAAAPTVRRAQIAESLGRELDNLAEITSVAPSLYEAFGRLLPLGREPVQAAFLARALNALAHLAPRLNSRELGDAAGAPSDVAVLVKALRAPEALADVEAEDPLVSARLRGVEVREQLLRAEGGTLGVAEVADLLGITRQAVDKRRLAGTLLAVTVGKRGYRYPAWQFSGKDVLRGLPQVLTALHVQPWTQLSWLLSGDPQLEGKRPFDLLRQGEVERVVRAASTYGVQGAA